MANLCWVIYTLINEPLNHKYDKLNLLTIQVFYGTVVFVVVYMIQILTGQVELINVGKIMANSELVFSVNLLEYYVDSCRVFSL